ncbi:hypothetical protein V8V91_27865 [Algoriphagus halophilus]|uniref:hypothetical protein n=1 Tax=Algoriphagus halophilus TaxID=226505 RepID=UPI003590272F
MIIIVSVLNSWGFKETKGQFFTGGLWLVCILILFVIKNNPMLNIVNKPFIGLFLFVLQELLHLPKQEDFSSRLITKWKWI